MPQQPTPASLERELQERHFYQMNADEKRHFDDEVNQMSRPQKQELFSHMSKEDKDAYRQWLTQERDRILNGGNASLSPSDLGRLQGVSTTLASFEQPHPPVKTLADAGVVQAAAHLTNQLPKLTGVSLVLA